MKKLKVGMKWLVEHVILPVVIIGMVAGAIQFGPQTASQVNANLVQMDKTWHAMKFAMEMDKLYDAAPSVSVLSREGKQIYYEYSPQGGRIKCWGIYVNDQAVCDLVLEILPYFPKQGLRPDIRVPIAVGQVPQGYPEHFFLGGRTQVQIGFVTNNYRFANPYSPWYDKSSFIAVLVHELGHTQGVIGRPAEIMEASNQTLMVEVLAAMSNEGDLYAVKPLLGELRGFAIDYLYAQAIDTPWYGFFDFWRKHFIYTTFEEQSKVDASTRYWFATPGRFSELKYILRAYGSLPYRIVSRAMARSDCDSGPLILVERGQHIKLDDLHYFLIHRYQLVRAAQHKYGK